MALIKKIRDKWNDWDIIMTVKSLKDYTERYLKEEDLKICNKTFCADEYIANTETQYSYN